MKHIVSVSVAILSSGLVASSLRFVSPETRSFVYVYDNKTVGGETFTRSTDSITGDIAMGKARIHYEAHIAADGMIPRLDIHTSRSDRPTEQRFISMIVGRDSAQVIERVARKVDTLRLASAPGTIPIFDPSIGLYELVVARARSQKSRTVSVPILKIDADDVDKSPNTSLRSLAGLVPGEVTFLSADTVMLGNAREKDKVRIIIGADGRARGAASGRDAKDHFAMRPTSKPVPVK